MARFRTKAPTPYCRAVVTWLRTENDSPAADRRFHGKHVLAPLTGQDAAALQAFAHLMELYTRSDEHGRHYAVVAMRATVTAAQESVRGLFWEAIPCVYDWSERERLWSLMGLDRP